MKITDKKIVILGFMLVFLISLITAVSATEINESQEITELSQDLSTSISQDTYSTYESNQQIESNDKQIEKKYEKNNKQSTDLNNDNITYHTVNNCSNLKNSYNIGELICKKDDNYTYYVQDIDFNLTVNGEKHPIVLTDWGYVNVNDSMFNKENPIFTTLGDNNITLSFINETTSYSYSTIFTTMETILEYKNNNNGTSLNDSYNIGYILNQNDYFKEAVRNTAINLTVNMERHEIELNYTSIIINNSIFNPKNPIFTQEGNNSIIIEVNDTQYGQCIIDTVFTTMNSSIKYYMENNGTYLNTSYNIGYLKFGNDIKKYDYIDNTLINLTVNGETHEILTNKGYIIIDKTYFNPNNPIFTTLGNNNITIQLNNTQYGQFNLNISFPTKMGYIQFLPWGHKFFSNSYSIGFLFYETKYDALYFNKTPLNLTINGEEHSITTDENGYILVNKSVFSENNSIFTRAGINNITISLNHEIYGEYHSNYTYTTEEGFPKYNMFNNGTSLNNSYNIGELRYSNTYDSISIPNTELNITINGETQNVITNRYGAININTNLFNPENAIFTTIGNNNITIQVNNTQYGEYTKHAIFTTKEYDIDCEIEDYILLNNQYYIGHIRHGNDVIGYTTYDKNISVNITVNNESNIINSNGYIHIDQKLFNENNPIFTTSGINNITLSFYDEQYGEYSNSYTVTTYEKGIRFDPYEITTILKPSYNIGTLKYGDIYNRFDDFEKNIPINITVNGETQEILTQVFGEVHINNSIFNPENPIFTTIGITNITLQVNNTKYGQYNDTIILTTKNGNLIYNMINNGTTLSPTYNIGTLYYGYKYYRISTVSSLNLTVNGETHTISQNNGININDSVFNKENPIFTTLGDNTIIISMINETDNYYNETIFTTTQHFLKFDNKNQSNISNNYEYIGTLKYGSNLSNYDYLDLYSNETILINLTVNDESKTINYTNYNNRININKTTYSEDNAIFTTPGENNITLLINDEKYGKLNYSFIYSTVGFRIEANPLEYDNATNIMTISGRVYNQNNQPEENIDLTIFINNKKIYISTDNNGNYQYQTEINDTQQYKIVTSINGKITKTTQLWNVENITEDNKIPIQINIKNYTEKLMSQDYLKISGNITDNNGNPIIIPRIFYTIQDLNHEYTHDTETIYCDELGNFEFNTKVFNYFHGYENYFATPGTYEFTLSIPSELEDYICDNISRTFIVEGRNLTDIETTIIINPIETIKNGDELDITGCVVDENRNPLENIWLEFTINNNTAHTSDFKYHYMAKTNSSGEFSLYLFYDDYQVGTNTIDASIIDYNTTKMNTTTTFEVLKNKIIIEIDDIPEVLVNVREINVTGRVTDENNNPVEEPIGIYIYDYESPFYVFTAGGKINFSIHAMRIGNNKIIISNYFPYQETNTIEKEFYVYSIDDRSEAKLTLTIDQNNDSKIIKIHGRALDDYKNPLNENIVEITINDNKTNVTTDTDGYYEFIFIPTTNNTYNVTVSLLNSTYYCTEQKDTITVDWFKEETDKNLTEIIEQQNNTINELNETINNLTNQNNILNQTIEQQKQNITNLTEENKNLTNTINYLNELIKQLNEIINNLNKNNSNLQETINEQNNTINYLASQNNILNQTIEQLKQNITNLTQENIKLNNTIQKQHNTINELNNKNDELNNKLSELKNINTQLNNIIKEYDNTITRLEEENQENTANINNLNKEKTQLENEIDTLEEENIELTKNNNQLYNDKIQLRNQLNNMTKELSEKDNKITTLQDSNNKLNKTINNLNQQIKTNNNTIKSQQNIINTLNNTNKNQNITIKNLETQNKQLNTTNQQLQNQITRLNKTIKELNKTPIKNTTTITVEKINGRVGTTIKLKATIKDNNQKPVNEGKVVFKVNGISLKDSDNNVIYAPIQNGIASINYVIPKSWMKNTTTLEAVYSETEHYQSSRKTITGHNITPGNVKLQIANLPVHENGDKIQFVITATDERGNTINGGTVIIKANGVTLKDSNGKALQATVKNGIAIIDYNITLGARIHDITAVYAYTGYNRIEAKNKLTVTKGELFIRCDPITTNKNTTQIIATIVDKTKNKIPFDVEVGVKIDGATVAKTTAKNGVINITVPTKYTKGTYTLVFTAGETGAYKSDRLTTVLIKQ